MKTVNLTLMGGTGERTLAAFLSALSRQHPKQHCYDMGYDCAIHGPNSDNCDFRLFATLDQTRA